MKNSLVSPVRNGYCRPGDTFRAALVLLIPPVENGDEETWKVEWTKNIVILVSSILKWLTKDEKVSWRLNTVLPA